MSATDVEQLLRVLAADDPSDPLLPPEICDAMGIGEGLSANSMPDPSDGAHLVMLRLRYGSRCLTHVMTPEQAKHFARGLLALANGPAPAPRQKGRAS